ncbi:MAG TPA: hypothetical protein VEY70_13180 [Metabacillus sp.]|nr:hypothetical protein [Metabacillus sp.]
MKKRRERGFFSNKTYKIHPFFITVFNHILSIYERDKLTETLIKAHFNYEIKQLPKCNKFQLLELMIKELNDNMNKENVSGLFVYDNRRIRELKKIYLRQHQWDNKRDVFNVRISSNTRNIIIQLSKEAETIGEVIELAISNFIANCETKKYEIIKFVMENNIDI